MSSGADSLKTIFYALGANFAIFVTKAVAAVMTGSGAMFAEAVHSLADCSNQVLLLVGLRSAKREASDDHPDVEELYRRSSAVDARISISTVYRTVKLFEDAGIIERHDFRDGRSRYETVPDEHHDHLIDLKSGEVIEFHSPEIEALQERIAREHGFRLVDHRLELYGVPLKEGE